MVYNLIVMSVFAIIRSKKENVKAYILRVLQRQCVCEIMDPHKYDPSFLYDFR